MTVPTPVRALVLAALVLAAGCSGAAGPTAGPREATPETAATTPTPEPPHNPWHTDPITVGVRVSAETNRSFAGPLNESLAYWNDNVGRTGYEGRFRLADGTDGADVVVVFVDEITECGAESGTALLGCAPLYESAGVAAGGEPTTVRVDADLNETVLVRTLNHEFGHTLGLDHGDADRFPFMTAEGPATTVPRPDLVNRSYFWAPGNTELSVYVDVSAVPERLRDDRRAAVDSVLRSYESSDRLPEGFAFVRADNRSSAEVVVTFGVRSGTDRYVDLRRLGRDTDADGRLEYLERAELAVDEDLEGDAERYVGYYMAFVLFADERSDVPEAYRS